MHEVCTYSTTLLNPKKKTLPAQLSPTIAQQCSAAPCSAVPCPALRCYAVLLLRRALFRTHSSTRYHAQSRHQVSICTCVTRIFAFIMEGTLGPLHPVFFLANYTRTAGQNVTLPASTQHSTTQHNTAQHRTISSAHVPLGIIKNR